MHETASPKPFWKVLAGSAGILCLGFLASLALLGPGSAQAAAGKVGDEAPALAQKDLAENMQDMQVVLGKNVILMEYWSIYCVSCVQEMPYLVEIFKKNCDPRFKDAVVSTYPADYKGLVAYSIDLDSFSPKRVQKFIDGLKFKIPYPVIVDANRDIANAFKVGMLPTTIIIGKDKKIKLYHIGFKPGDEKDIEEIIKAETAK
jgi:peroxiredoxin